jgi:hypothetical protein
VTYLAKYPATRHPGTLSPGEPDESFWVSGVFGARGWVSSWAPNPITRVGWSSPVPAVTVNMTVPATLWITAANSVAVIGDT